MSALLVSGKFGDAIAALPIIYHEFQKTGEIQTVITSDRYLGVFEGCSYVCPISSGLSWGDLHGSIKWSKERYEEVKILQCHGDKFPFEQTQKSFQQEVYLRAGVIDQWDKLELVFDQRDEKRERDLISANVPRRSGRGRPFEKFILLADSSESAAFPKMEELHSMLQASIGATHKIIRLSTVKAEKIYDLIGLYDKADALVSIDTAHAHLCQASQVPKFIISTDGWRGSAFRKNLKFYMKYSEWDSMSKELVAAVFNCVTKNQEMKISNFETVFKNGYNLSSINFQGRPVYTYRYHHAGDWKTRLAICVDGVQSKLEVVNSDKNISYEDLRLYELGGKLHGIYTVSSVVDRQFRCYMAFGEIKNNAGKWTIEHVQIQYPRNDFTWLNKNFTPFIYQDKLAVIYGIQGENQIVLCLDSAGKPVSSHQSPAPKWGHGEIRGGAVLPRGDTLLRFFHSRTNQGARNFRYHVGASIMEAVPPFKTLKVCSTPVISGDGEVFPDCRHYKGNVSIIYGAIQEGDKILISIGKNDSRCQVIELSEKDLNLI